MNGSLAGGFFAYAELQLPTTWLPGTWRRMNVSWNVMDVRVAIQDSTTTVAQATGLRLTSMSNVWTSPHAASYTWGGTPTSTAGHTQVAGWWHEGGFVSDVANMVFDLDMSKLGTGAPTTINRMKLTSIAVPGSRRRASSTPIGTSTSAATTPAPTTSRTGPS